MFERGDLHIDVGGKQTAVDGAGAEIIFVSFRIRRARLRAARLRILRAEFFIQSVHGARRDVIDEFQQIRALAVDRIGPNAVAAARVGQLEIDAHQIARGEEVTFEHAIDLQLFAHRRRIDFLVVILQHGRCRPHLQ